LITLPIDAFFPLDPELAEECDVMKTEAFRPGSSTSAHQAAKLIAAMHNASEKTLPRYGALLNRAVLHFPFSRTPSAT
jgi:hypothetical protein